MNYFKTAILLAALTALFGGVGFLIGGQTGMLIALGIALAMNLFAYWNSDKMVLRMQGAQQVDARSAPEYYEIVRQLAETPNCRCRRFTSCTIRSRTLSRPAATRKTPPWPRPRASWKCSPRKRWRA